MPFVPNARIHMTALSLVCSRLSKQRTFVPACACSRSRARTSFPPAPRTCRSRALLEIGPTLCYVPLCCLFVMVPALLKLKLRKRAAAAPPAEHGISDVIQPTTSGPALDPTLPPTESVTLYTPCAPPPRSYAQLTDTAHELVAASWDPNLSIRQWLDAVRDLASE